VNSYTPEIRADLVTKVQKFLLDGISQSESIDGLSRHLDKHFGVTGAAEQAVEILNEVASKNGHATKEKVVEAMTITAPAAATPEVIEANAGSAAPAELPAERNLAPLVGGVPAPLAKDIAAKMIRLGGHVIFFPRGQKGTKESGWQNEATRDMSVVEQKTKTMPYANVGVVGKPDGLCLFDDDESTLNEYESQHGKIPSYRVRSVSGGTHLYLMQTDLTRTTGNINGKNETGAETWSVRSSNRYVVAAGSSAHSNNDPNQPEAFYQCIDDVPAIEAPDSFIEFLKAKAAQTSTKTSSAPRAVGVKVAHGGIHDYLVEQAGRLRHMNVPLDMLETTLVALAHENCEAPINESQVKQVARSFAKYEPGDPARGRIEFMQTVMTKEAKAKLDEAAAEAAAEATRHIDAWLNGDEELEAEQVIGYCALLSRTKYENRRTKAAKKLGWRTSVLDDARRDGAPKESSSPKEGEDVLVSEAELWGEPVNLSEVLDEIERIIRTYIFFKRPEDAVTTALWSAQTHASTLQTKFPYLGVRSPVPECGKTTLLTLLFNLVRRGFMASSVTTASVFRVMHILQPTLIIDEMDTILEKDSEFFGIMNSGHSKEAGRVVRVLGDDLELKSFITYGPKAYGMIGNAPDSFKSRSLPIILEAKLESDGVENYPEDDTALKAELHILARKLARWTQDNEQAILACKPDTTGLTNRRRDNWRPLLVFATLASPEWVKKARAAAGVEDPFEQECDNKVFLQDVRNIFHTRKVDRMEPSDLLKDLRFQEASGWAEWGRGKDGLSQKGLSQLFGAFGIKSKRTRKGDDTVRAYHLEDMTESFRRYLKDVPVEEVKVRADVLQGTVPATANNRSFN
jgi:hypothetical protein